MAACVLSGTAGVAVDCSGDSELPVTGIPDVSIVNGGTSPQIGVHLTTDGTAFENNTSITSQVTDPTGRNTFNVFGIASTAIDDSEWSIVNNDTVTAVHNGIGQLAAIGFLGNNGEVSVENSGMLGITRGAITLATNSAGSLTATSGAGTGTLGNAAAIWVQEEENESLFVENSGTISADGKLTAGIFSRGAFMSVENEEGSDITATGTGSVAIEAHNGTDQKDEGEFHNFFIGNTVIENEGTISGTDIVGAAIQIVDANGLRYMAARVAEGGGPYDPLTITSQAGRRDSTIINSGEIDGNIYLGAGNHVFVNAAEGEVTGNIDVDQRRNFSYAITDNPLDLPLQVFRAGEGGGDDDDDDDAGGQVFSSVADFLAAFPDHHFEFDNAAPLIGDLTVHTNTDSTIELRPHITGSGAGSSVDDPSDESGYISGTLAIGTGWPAISASTIDTTTTLSPVLDHAVHDGQWFLVANTLFGDALPLIEEGDPSFLVDWTAAKNANNSLVVGSTVADASTVPGLSRPGINALNTLLTTTNSTGLDSLTLAIEKLGGGRAVRSAGEQLRPEVNGATAQIPFLFASMVNDRVRNRLVQFDGVGAPGGFTSYSGYPQPSRLAGTGSSEDWDNAALIYDEDDYRTYGPRTNSAWGQGMISHIDQGTVDSVDGYDADLRGLVAGYDGAINSSLRAGAAFGFAQTDVDNKGVTSANSTSFQSYLGILYGMWQGSAWPWYVNGTLGLGIHNYDTSRILTAGSFGDHADGSFDGIQTMASIDAGYPLHLGSSIFLPVASLTYNNLDQDGYTETSNGGMALKIAANDTDSLRSGFGARLLSPVLSVENVLELRAVWYHEFENTSQVVTASFAAGSGSFVAPGPEPGRDTADLGAGIVMRSKDASASLTLDYDAAIQEDFVAHTGLARVRVNF